MIWYEVAIGVAHHRTVWVQGWNQRQALNRADEYIRLLYRLEDKETPVAFDLTIVKKQFRAPS